MRLLPPLPRTSSARPVGADHHRRRHHRGDPLARRAPRGSRRGWRSSSPIMLLAMTPVPGITQPDPSPFDVVMVATLPVAVAHAHVGGAASGAPPSELGRHGPRPRTSSVATIAWPPAARARVTPTAARPARALLEEQQTERDELSTERRRRVGEQPMPAPAHLERRPLDDLVAHEVVGGEQPSAGAHPASTAPATRRVGEATLVESAEEGRQLGVDEAIADAEERDRPAPRARPPRRAGEDRLEDAQHVAPAAR